MNNTTPLSLYIHIPFCVKKCRYCDFYSIKYRKDTVKDFINLLKTEASLVIRDLDVEDSILDTVYMGGGTPSLLDAGEFEDIAGIVHDSFPLSRNCEWSIECNPSSFSDTKADRWIASGVNRISIGVQSFCDRELTILGRSHTASQGLRAVEDAAAKGFKSTGIDIITGVPGQNADSVRKSLAKVFKLGVVDHLSVYELTVNRGTPFGRHSKLLPFPSEEEMDTIYMTVGEMGSGNGFRQYEVSNFAKEGIECRHNKVYWRHLPYIGLGPSAHSYFKRKRFANVSNLNRYAELLEAGERPLKFKEYIDNGKLKDEMIMLRLRTSEGIDTDKFEKITGKSLVNSKTRGFIKKLQCDGFAVYKPPVFRLTRRGLMSADGIAGKLISYTGK